MYFLTIEVDDQRVVDGVPFDDYAAALGACFRYCEPLAHRAVLAFRTETISGRFARSYAQLDRPECIDVEAPDDKERYAAAVRTANAFAYDKPLFFLIESEAGIADRKRFEDEDEDG